MGFFDWFKSDPKKESMKKAAKAYKQIMDFSKKDKIKIVDSDTTSNGFLEVHSDVIEDYLKAFGSNKEENKDIDALLQAYFKRHPEKKPAPPAPLEPAQDAQKPEDDKKAVEQTEQQDQSGEDSTEKQEQQETTEKKEEKDKDTSGEDREKVNAELRSILVAETDANLDEGTEDEHKKLSEGISPSAMKGLRDISCWCLRNGTKSGLIGDDAIRFVTRGVLKEDARIKLFAYYLVEKNLVDESNEDTLKIALADSQTNYTPNLVAFKDKMIASKFKFWKRFDASHFNWPKLGEAMRIAVSNKELMMSFSSLGGHEVSSGDVGDVEEEETTEQATQEEGNKTDTATAGEAMSENPSAASKEKAKEVATKEQGKEKAPANPEAEKAKKAAEDRAKKLSEYTEAGKRLMKMKEELSKNPVDPMTKKAQINTQLAILDMLFQDLVDCDASVSDAYKTLTETKFHDVRELKEKKSTAEKIGVATEIGSTVLDQRGLPQTVMEGYNSAAKFVKGINPSWKLSEIPKDKVEFMKKLGPTDDILGLLGSALSAYNLVLDAIEFHENKSMMTAGTLMSNGLELFSDAFGIVTDVTEAIQGLSNVAEATMATTSAAMGALSGGIDLISAGMKLVDISDRKKSLKSASKKLSGDSYAEKMGRLGQRNASIGQNIAIAKAVKGGVELVGGLLTVSGVASVVGAALGGVGTIIGLGTMAYTYFAKKQNKKDTIDDYINMDKMMDIVTKSVKNKEDMDVDEIKDQLRIAMAAELKYSGIDDFFNGIINKYAMYIYNHIFFQNGDRSKPLKGKHSSNGGYIDLLAGFGLEPDFSKRKPNPKSIADYLKKV